MIFILRICDEIDPAVFLPLFQAASFSFCFPLTIITTIMEAMRDARQKRHTISGIDPHPSPHREKNVGSGAAQFRLDSAIDRMLYQPLPWQLTEQGQSPCVYLHLSSTPCHLVLVPGSLCRFKCHPKMLYTVIPITNCIYDCCFFVIVQFAFASPKTYWIL